VISKKTVDIGNGVDLCAYYFDPKNEAYVLLKEGNTLISIDPFTGEITDSVYIGKFVTNMIFHQEKRTVMGITGNESGTQSIDVFDCESGKLISSKEIPSVDGFILCISGYDSEMDRYIAVSPDYEVLFIEPSTGEIKRTYKLDINIADVKFWRK
jgi:hypothetical protein